MQKFFYFGLVALTVLYFIIAACYQSVVSNLSISYHRLIFVFPAIVIISLLLTNIFFFKSIRIFDQEKLEIKDIHYERPFLFFGSKLSLPFALVVAFIAMLLAMTIAISLVANEVKNVTMP